MSNNDWDTVTKIGSRVAGGGGGPRQTTIKSRSQLNAAQRAGAVVGTEKKYGSANSGRATAGTGQFQTKVAETNDIVKPKFMDPKQAQALTKAATGIKTSDIQRHTSINGSLLSKYLGGANRPIPTQQEWAALERALGFHLRGAKMGTPNGSKTALPRPEATQSKAAA